MFIQNRKRLVGKRGVSPVIATILMVAITVVLAAVLYVMVTGYMQGGATTPVSGAITYITDSSSPVIGNATYNLAMSNPATPPLSEVTVKILDPNGTVVSWLNGTDPSGGEFVITWRHLTSDANHIKGGDRLIINHIANKDIRKYEAIVSISGYSGTMTGPIPP